jgi:hypothetical protein
MPTFNKVTASQRKARQVAKLKRDQVRRHRTAQPLVVREMTPADAQRVANARARMAKRKFIKYVPDKDGRLRRTGVQD